MVKCDWGRLSTERCKNEGKYSFTDTEVNRTFLVCDDHRASAQQVWDIFAKYGSVS